MRRDCTTAEYKQLVASHMKEKEWMQQVIDLARTLGYTCYHTWNSRHSEKGYPDLTLCRPGGSSKSGRLLFAELKREKEKPTPEQQRWLDMLKACGCEVYVWRPSDIDEVIRILQREEKTA